MNWRTEPGRSRILLSSFVTAAVLITAAGVWSTRLPEDSRWNLGTEALPCLGVAVLLILDLTLSVRYTVRKPRWRFSVEAGAFAIPLPSLALRAGVLLMFWALITGRAVAAGLAGDLIEAAVFGFVTLIITAFAGALTYFAWRGMLYRLTPEGIEQRTPVFARLIPWHALAPGGPPAPPLGKGMPTSVELVTTDPDSVQQRGVLLGSGTPQRPAVAIKTPVHPWLLAGAIQWYAEHPEHRPAIGTEAEHDRLTAAILPPPS